jgi:hypothetical protein
LTAPAIIRAQRKTAITLRVEASTRLRFIPTWAHFTYLDLLEFRDGYYARRGLLNHLNSDGFDCWSDRLFRPRLPRSFLHWVRLGLAVRFIALADFATLRALASLADSFPRFCTFDPFLRFAMMDPPVGLRLPAGH